jgi:hypothetical protein
MKAKTIVLNQEEANILEEFEQLGFSSEEEMLAEAFRLLELELRKKKREDILLEESAILYAEVYEEDLETKELNSFTEDWED